MSGQRAAGFARRSARPGGGPPEVGRAVGGAGGAETWARRRPEARDGPPAAQGAPAARVRRRARRWPLLDAPPIASRGPGGRSPACGRREQEPPGAGLVGGRPPEVVTGGAAGAGLPEPGGATGAVPPKPGGATGAVHPNWRATGPGPAGATVGRLGFPAAGTVVEAAVEAGAATRRRSGRLGLYGPAQSS